MNDDNEQCARLTRLLARMDEGYAAAGREAAPAGALLPDEIAWAAAHLDRCPRCAAIADDTMTPPLDALRALDAADAPSDAFFAAQRDALMAVIRAAPEVASLREVLAPKRAPVRAAGHAAERAAGVRPVVAPGGARQRVVLWTALAAGVVLLITSALLRTDQDQLAEVISPPTIEVAGLLPATGAAALADAEDAWLVASNDSLVVEVPAGERPLAGLSDDELDEIEGVFVSVPGWS